ncbi:MAG: hypothetical protein KatS3mg082_1469 [Nitrospiraceae bacterium]|nr:MAG: hypothetical protein KatS3mg082_1469 [Nitrospiraceae bacterium]
MFASGFCGITRETESSGRPAWVIDEAAQNVVRHGIPDEGGEMAAVVVAPYRGQPNVQVVFCWHSIPLGEDDDRRMRRFLDRRVTRSTPGGRGLQYIRALSSRMTLPRLLTSTEQEAVAKAFGFHPAPAGGGLGDLDSNEEARVRPLASSSKITSSNFGAPEWRMLSNESASCRAYCRRWCLALLQRRTPRRRLPTLDANLCAVRRTFRRFDCRKTLSTG